MYRLKDFIDAVGNSMQKKFIAKVSILPSEMFPVYKEISVELYEIDRNTKAVSKFTSCTITRKMEEDNREKIIREAEMLFMEHLINVITYNSNDKYI